MGRLILVILLIAAAYLVWKAFGPGTWKRGDQAPSPAPIKGPDDDEQFLWELEKKQFKKKREKQKAEELARQEEAAIKRAKERFQRHQNGQEAQSKQGDQGEPGGQASLGEQGDQHGLGSAPLRPESAPHPRPNPGPHPDPHSGLDPVAGAGSVAASDPDLGHTNVEPGRSTTRGDGEEAED